MIAESVLTLKEFFKLEKSHRLAKNWFMGHFKVVNSKNEVVKVAIKSYGFYNQILEINDDGINYSFGHSVDKVSRLQLKLAEIINGK